MKINIKNIIVLFLSLFTILFTSQQAFAWGNAPRYKCHLESPMKACGKITNKDFNLEQGNYRTYLNIDCPNGKKYVLKKSLDSSIVITFSTIDDNSFIAKKNKASFGFNFECSKIEE
jgi:hypothetical protein